MIPKVTHKIITTVLQESPLLRVVTHRFATRIIRGSSAPFVFVILFCFRFFIIVLTHLHKQFLGGFKKISRKTKTSKIFSVTQRDTGGIGALIHAGTCFVSARVRTEDPVETLLYLSISKPYQLSSTDPPLSTVGWYHGWSYQQLVDKETVLEIPHSVVSAMVKVMKSNAIVHGCRLKDECVGCPPHISIQIQRLVCKIYLGPRGSSKSRR